MIRRALGLFLIALLIPVRTEASETAPDIRHAQAEGIGAKAYCLIERDSGRILFAENENERLPMASTTKIMTAILAAEHCSMDETVTAGENAYGVTGTSMYLQKGEKLPMEQMLQGLMLRSGNDAAVAIAEHIAGDTESFARMMNERARQLGADAHFVTPNGLDAQGHGASALAMAKIGAHALKNEDLRRIVSMREAVVPWEGSEYDRVLTNKNRLLKEYEGATGIKTGYTSKAGRCLVFSAERDGMELVGAVLNCYTWFDSAEKLLDAGFAEYEMKTALKKGEIALRARVEGGAQETVGAAAQQELRAPLGQHEAYLLETEIDPGLKAPVKKGQKVGTARMTAADSGETIAQCALIAQADVPENTAAQAILRIIGQWGLMDAEGYKDLMQ